MTPASPCPSWCELKPGHRSKTVDGVRIREHRALIKMPDHQQWPPERAQMYAEERDGAVDLPRGRFRCDCTRPPWSDPAVREWKRRPEYVVSQALVIDLCSVCTSGLHGATTMEVVMQVERARLRMLRDLTPAPPLRVVAFEVHAFGLDGVFGPQVLGGPGDTYRVLDNGGLELVAGGRRRTYAAGAWVYVEELATT